MLLAKQGVKVTWHFAHAVPAEGRSCAETALHLAGKRVLQQMVQLTVPGPSWPELAQVDSTGRALEQLHKTNLYREIPCTELTLQGVQLEVPHGTRRLDAIVQTDRGRLGVEIRVTHAVDDLKREELQMLELPVIEIDLRELLKLPLDWETVASWVSRLAPRKCVATRASVTPELARELQVRLAGQRDTVEAALASVCTPTEQERRQLRELARSLGLDVENLPKGIGSLGWLKHRQLDSKARRVFNDTHHLVWQLALYKWIGLRGPCSRLSTEEICQGVQALLDIRARSEFDFLDFHATRLTLLELEHPTLQVVAETRQGGSPPYFRIEDKTLLAKASAFRNLPWTAKRAQVERWLALEPRKPAPLLGTCANAFDVPNEVWQRHLWLVLIKGRTGQGLRERDVVHWLVQRYPLQGAITPEAAAEQLMGHLCMCRVLSAVSMRDVSAYGDVTRRILQG